MSQAISFDVDIALADQLVSLLAREQNNLVRVDIDAIETLLEEKAALLQKINEAAKLRYATLAEHAYEPNEQGMTAWLDQKADSAAQHAWLNFQKTLTQAKEMNRVNGLLITKHFNNTRSRLSVLQSAGQQASPQFYGPDGQVSGNANLRGMSV
jgi:flagella synthesis protein FlgN